MSARRVAIVVQRYGVEVNGGAEQHARWLAERLAEPSTAGEATEVTVLTTCALDYITWADHYPAGEETINGVRVLRARHAVPRRLTGLTRLLWDGTFVLNGGMVRPSRRPELVLASTPSIGAGLLGRRLADRYDVPFGIVVQHPTGGIPPFADNDFENNSSGASLVLGAGEAPRPVHTGDLATP